MIKQVYDNSYFLKNNEKITEYNELLKEIHENLANKIDKYNIVITKTLFGLEQVLKNNKIIYDKEVLLNNLQKIKSIDIVDFSDTKSTSAADITFKNDNVIMKIDKNVELNEALCHELCPVISFSEGTKSYMDGKIHEGFKEGLNTWLENKVLEKCFFENDIFQTTNYMKENSLIIKITSTNHGYEKMNYIAENLGLLYEKEMLNLIFNGKEELIDKLKNIQIDTESNAFEYINNSYKNFKIKQNEEYNHLHINKAMCYIIKDYTIQNNLSELEYKDITNKMIKMSPLINNINILEKGLKEIDKQLGFNINRNLEDETSLNYSINKRTNLVEKEYIKNLIDGIQTNNKIYNISNNYDFLETFKFDYNNIKEINKNDSFLKTIIKETNKEKIKEFIGNYSDNMFDKFLHNNKSFKNFIETNDLLNENPTQQFKEIIKGKGINFKEKNVNIDNNNEYQQEKNDFEL